MAVIIDGKAVAKQLRAELAQQVAQMAPAPGLDVVLVGEDPASQVYVRGKIKACKEIGIRSREHRLPGQTTERELLDLLAQLNADKSVHGILVQLPLPGHIDERRILSAVLPQKDVDAFHPENVGRIVSGDYLLAPCTPAGILELLDRYDIPIEGRHCVVVGRSNIVGKPQAILMLHRNATVSIAHSRTADLGGLTRQADILVAATGRAHLIGADMVKPGAVVIDAGITRGESGKLVGDVDFEAVAPKASHITPVPGGVGPMTIAMLMKNTVLAAQLAKK
ncbi:MAG: bifunctional methylenetetrahydrofolate dehydrogenase/methenyltetrahydrofolate cyclohydrolase FolD [Clostridiales bacterium]|nr:bifunctional methylenetetrahydrofolate dehydrogenase/methenyltetrahydrofolate cyclohydrolase FolD [Clostridiales bacterium]